MHSKYGNTTLRLQPLGTVVQAKVELSLEALIPNFTYTRSFLLQCHTPPEPNNDLYPQLPILIDRSAVIQTTPPSLTTGSAAKARTGRRHRAFTKNGKLVYFQPRSRRKTRRPHRIHELSNRRGIHGINRIYGIKTLTKHRVPPPRGTPGASPEADEEYPHPGQTAKGQSRGAGAGGGASIAFGVGLPDHNGIKGRAPFFPRSRRPRKPLIIGQDGSDSPCYGSKHIPDKGSTRSSIDRPHRLCHMLGSSGLEA